MGILLLPFAADAQFSYEQIDHPVDSNTQVFGINDSGDAVGIGAILDESFVYESRDGLLTLLPPADGYLSTVVVGINDAGEMVGTVIELDSSRSGFFRDEDGTYTIFSYPDGQSYPLPRGISNKGLISGYLRSKADNSFAGVFIYDPKTVTFTDIDLGPATFAIAHGINSKGEVVGNAFFNRSDDPCGNDPTPGFVEYGWLLTKHGEIIYFQINGDRTSARGINDSHLIVGQARDPITGERKAFVIEAPESSCETLAVGPSDLLQFPGGRNSIGEGITNSGDIVGIFTGADSNVHGFIARPQGKSYLRR